MKTTCSSTSSILYWLGNTLFAAYLVVEFASGPSTPLEWGMVGTGTFALALLVLDRLRPSAE